MKNHNLLFLILLCCSTFIFVGCHDKEYDEEAPPGSNVKYIMDDPNYRPGENVPPPQLSEGQILNIRLIYAIDEKDENNDEWYKVILKRNDSYWSDSVQIQGLSRTNFRHWDDYGFYSKNFNWQIEKEQYGTTSLDGVYTLEILGSNGFSSSYQLNWKNGKWTNIASAELFYVP